MPPALSNVYPLGWAAKDSGLTFQGYLKRAEREGRVIRAFEKLWVTPDNHAEILRELEERGRGKSAA